MKTNQQTNKNKKTLNRFASSLCDVGDFDQSEMRAVLLCCCSRLISARVDDDDKDEANWRWCWFESDTGDIIMLVVAGAAVAVGADGVSERLVRFLSKRSGVLSAFAVAELPTCSMRLFLYILQQL